MMWHIGEFAQRLRITARTVRHYEQIGLLVPQSIDPGSGYRIYGPNQLVRGLQIEQLKATGLGLGAVRALLDDPTSWASTLADQRVRTTARLEAARTQLTTIDLFRADRGGVVQPEIIVVESSHVVTLSITASAQTLGRAIRRAMQQLGRATRARGGRCRTFSVRMPLDLSDEPFAVEVRGHLDASCEGSSVQPAERCLVATWIGSIDLLPVVYDVVLEDARDQGLATTGEVVEHYLDLAPIGTTTVRVPLAS